VREDVAPDFADLSSASHFGPDPSAPCGFLPDGGRIQEGSMKDDRLRVSVKPEYCGALGLATYCFASMSWDAVWCCEKLRLGSINSVPNKTAGIIGATFLRLVDKRNDIMHSPPATAPGGEQMFNRHGRFITVGDLEEMADEFTACSLRLNALLHGPLSGRP
jgi:hypothetical protein